MGNDWKQETLGDVTEWSSGGTPRKNEPKFWNGDIPWISATSMKSIHLWNSELKLTQSGIENGSRLAAEETVLLLVRGSELFKRIPIGIAMRPLAFNQDVKALRAKKGLLPKFLLYWLLANEDGILEKVEQTGIGAGKLDTNVMKQLPFQLPSLAEQHRIAYVLGTLDDRIELNRRMNRTLEKMAAALFKSWFVDFDPVRAKAEDRDPGLPADIAALFPDSFTDSPLGPIPDGWEARTLTDVIELNPKRILSKGTLAPFLEMSNMPTQGPSPDAWRLREMGSGMKFMNGDTLLARITPCLENGKTAFVDFLADGQVGWGSTEYIVMRPKGDIPLAFAYLLARTKDFRTFAIQQMTGSSGRQRVPAESLAKYIIAVPVIDSTIFRAFGALIAPMFSRITAASHHSRNLAQLRDTLLPKLLSGEVEVPEMEDVA